MPLSIKSFDQGNSTQLLLSEALKSGLKSVSMVWGRGGGVVERAADSGPYDPSLTPLGEKKEN